MRGSQNEANKETVNLETTLGVATLGSAPDREDEDQAPKSQNAAISVLQQENDNFVVQEEILTNKRADEWARVEHLDHEINRAKAMAKAADRTQESTKNPDKEPNKQDPQVNKPPLMEATPRSAPDGESVAQTTEKSDVGTATASR